MIASINEHWGIGTYEIKNEAITADDFAAYLKKMRAGNFKRPLALFMDNLPVHKSNIVKPLYDTLNIMPIYNVAYSPELNPIEAVFSKLDQPLPLGYCNVGTVAEAGHGVTTYKMGERVISNGYHAEVVSVPINLCARVPDNVTDEAAALTCL